MCYRESGLFERIDAKGKKDQGVWVTLAREKLRWLRRCVSRGRPVAPSDCSYFGRYLVAGNDLHEEEACPKGWLAAQAGPPAPAELAGKCGEPARKLEGEPVIDELAARLATEAAALPPTPVASAPASPPASAPAVPGENGRALAGTWIGAVGSGPAKVTLIFEARDDGIFKYTLEAAGEADSASGKWQTDGSTLVLEHADGEIEKIPFTLADGSLLWQDSDLGELRLARKGS